MILYVSYTRFASNTCKTFPACHRFVFVHSFSPHRKTYLCLTVVTVSAATLVVMFFAATSKPVQTAANPVHMHQKQVVMHSLGLLLNKTL